MIKIDKVYQPKEMLLAKKEKKECFTWEIQFSFLVWSSFNSVDAGYRIYFAIHNEHGLIQSSFLSMCFFPCKRKKEKKTKKIQRIAQQTEKNAKETAAVCHTVQKSGVFLLVGVGFLWIFLPRRQERAGGKK